MVSLSGGEVGGARRLRRLGRRGGGTAARPSRPAPSISQLDGSGTAETFRLSMANWPLLLLNALQAPAALQLKANRSIPTNCLAPKPALVV